MAFLAAMPAKDAFSPLNHTTRPTLDLHIHIPLRSLAPAALASTIMHLLAPNTTQYSAPSPTHAPPSTEPEAARHRHARTRRGKRADSMLVERIEEEDEEEEDDGGPICREAEIEGWRVGGKC